MKKIVILLLALNIGFAACKKDDKSNSPLIEIYSPYENMLVPKNGTVVISGRITHSKTLHGYSIELKSADNVVLFSRDVHTHKKEITFSESAVIENDTPDRLELRITAIVDHNDEKVDKKVSLRYIN